MFIGDVSRALDSRPPAESELVSSTASAMTSESSLAVDEDEKSALGRDDSSRAGDRETYESPTRAEHPASITYFAKTSKPAS